MLSPLFFLSLFSLKITQASTVDFTANHQDEKKKKKDSIKLNTTELLML